MTSVFENYSNRNVMSRIYVTDEFEIERDPIFLGPL